MSPTKARRRWLRWLLAGVALLVVIGVGGPFVYIHFIEGPAPAAFTLPSLKTTTTTAGSGTTSAKKDSSSTTATVSGTWVVASGSQAGYRVQEVLAGQDNTAVGRTSDVTGTISVSGSTVSSASFLVDLRTVHSDHSERDVQFNGRIMDTAKYPDATFKLTKPIDLGSIPAIDKTMTESVVGTLTMHGTTRTVAFTVEARYTGTEIQMTGSIPIVFADWNISNPSFAGFVTTQNHGLLEFLLIAKRS
ncbi:MAG: YceI family protein [Acidimicrobiales bacterium]